MALYQSDDWFHQDCPYYREKSPSKGSIPIYRLKETFEDNETFIGDSFGDHAWINVITPRNCPPTCLCHKFADAAEEDIFAFTVTKKPNSIQIRIHSTQLCLEVMNTVISVNEIVREPIGDGSGALNGLALLKYRPYLHKGLVELREKAQNGNTTDQVVAELSLLVYGVLNDAEIFESFGYLNLLKQGWLGGKQWKAFQNVQVNSHIDMFEQLYTLIDEDPTTPDFDQSDDPEDPPNSSSAAESVPFGFSFGKDDVFSLPSPDESASWLNVAVDPDCEALSMAAFTGNEQIVRDLLARGVDPNNPNLPFYTRPAICESILGGHDHITRILIEHGAMVEGISVPGWSSRTYRPLLTAIKNRASSAVTMLLNGSHGGNSLGVNFLLDAPIEDRWIVARILLDHGFDPSLLARQAAELKDLDDRLLAVILGNDGGSGHLQESLHARSIGHFDFVIIEAQKVLDLNRRLISAVKNGSTENARIILDQGADPSWALWTALVHQNLELAEFLLQRGADPRFLNIKDSLVTKISSENLAEMLCQAARMNDTQLLHILLDQGGDVNAMSPQTGKSVLVESIGAGNHRGVEFLLKRGAAVDGVYSPGRASTVPLAEAMKQRNSGIVSLLLQHGASYQNTHSDNYEDSCQQTNYDLDDKPLRFHPASWNPAASRTEKGFIGTARSLDHDLDGGKVNRDQLVRLDSIRQELERDYIRPEATVLQAVRDRDSVKVQTLLQCASSATEDGMSIPATVLDLNSLQEDTTALMEAVRRGCLRISKMLIQHGADVNIMASHETALSIAAKTGAESMLRLLLGYSADPHVAVLMLRIDTSNGAGTRAIRKLNTFAERFRNDLMQNAQKIRRGEVMRLRNGFWKQHNRMKCVAMGSSFHKSWRSLEAQDLVVQIDLSKRWVYGLELQTRKAWNIGLGTMRGLCNKILPRDLNETLLFLALAKAMSMAIDRKDARGPPAEFNEDLGRWQLLFDEGDGGRLAFQEAVKAIWGVDLSTLKSKPSPDSATLEQFQNMALNLVVRADEVYKRQTMDHLGLLSTQSRWRHTRQKNSPLSITPESSKIGSTPDEGCCQAVSREGITKVDEPMDPQRDLGRENICSKKADLLLVILMAGAIFAMVIEFILVVRDPSRSVTNTIQCTYSLLQAYFGFEVRYSVVTSENIDREGSSPRTTRLKRKAPIGSLDEGQKFLKASPSGQRAHNSSKTPSHKITPASTPETLSARQNGKTFCDKCQRYFSSPSNLTKHLQGREHLNKRYPCSYCKKDYLRNDERLKHERRHKCDRLDPSWS